MEAEYWAYHYASNPAREEFEDEDFDAEEILAALEEDPDAWEDLINDRT